MADNMTVSENIRLNMKCDKDNEHPQAKKTMSVPEMRRLLGLKKTEGYWLVHRKFFKTEIIGGQMRVHIESFEKWYANQVKHKKISGDKPGEELIKTSYSFKDAANLLGIHDSSLYDIWRKENLETITVDFVKRIPVAAFEKWYENQIMYRKADKMPSITELEADCITLQEAAALLGITREKLSVITRTSRFKDMFEIRVFENKKWISKKSFRQFLNAQNVYKTITDKEAKKQEQNPCIRTGKFISRAEAAVLAGVTTAAVTRWMQAGHFPYKGTGRSLRINRNEYLKWLREYKEGAL